VVERTFALDGTATLLAIAFSIVLLAMLWRRRFVPSLFFSDTKGLTLFEGSLRSRFVGLPRKLYFCSLFLLIAAFCDPHFLVEKPVDEESGFDQAEEKVEQIAVPTEGIGIYLVVDTSGSMQQPIAVSIDGKPSKMTRLDLLKRITSQFVKGNRALKLDGRKDDMIGLVSFARVAQVEVPLTLDHDVIVERLSKLSAVNREEQEGTALGYAIFKTANLIAATKHFALDLVKEGKPAYDIKNTVVVLVTDGLQTTNPLDAGHALRTIDPVGAAKVAKENGIRLYIINVEPKILYSQFNAERKQLRDAAEMTGGKLFIASNHTPLQSIYQEIDRLEKGLLPSDRKMEAVVNEKRESEQAKYNRVSLYPHLVAFAMMIGFLATLLETTYLRRAP